MTNQVSGVVEVITGPNKGGYYSIKVGGVWHGIGKMPPAFQKGAQVSFNAYLKDGQYSTVKGPIAVVDAPPPTKADTSPPAPRHPVDQAKDNYWRNKEKGDAAKDARISFFAAYERALGFVQLAIANGAFPKVEKAKPADKLDVLRAFVLEVTNELVALSSGEKAARPAATNGSGDVHQELKKLDQPPEEWE